MLVDSISAFQQIFPDTLIDHLVYQTNLYVMQTNGINTKPAFFNEMKQFLGINILMGIKKLPSYRDYWSSIYEMRDIQCDHDEWKHSITMCRLHIFQIYFFG
jgi:hypothetical protein